MKSQYMASLAIRNLDRETQNVHLCVFEKCPSFYTVDDYSHCDPCEKPLILSSFFNLR